MAMKVVSATRQLGLQVTRRAVSDMNLYLVEIKCLFVSSSSCACQAMIQHASCGRHGAAAPCQPPRAEHSFLAVRHS